MVYGAAADVGRTRTPRRILPRARLYETLRTAHLERAHTLSPATLVYRHRRYDFDSETARGLHLVQAGPWATARLLASSDVRELEINEPLMLASLRRTAVALLALDVGRRLRRRPRAAVCTYAIANDDPLHAPVRGGIRGRARHTLERVLAARVARRVDRVVFGTQSALDLYARDLPVLLSRAEHTLIPALPAPCGCGPAAGGTEAPGRVLFVGAFDERKGLRQLVDAWPAVAARRPAAHLTLVGKGPLQSLVEGLALERSDVTLAVDPPREEIHRLQRDHAVLVLLSQRTARWREQVGLPVVEGLAHGCTVLTTTETGLASWLAQHGHGVLDRDASPTDVADALVDLLDCARPASSVLADLPDEDGRLEADRWLFPRRA